MDPVILEEFRGRKKRQTMKLVEVSELTKELIQTVGRRDPVSVRMLVRMRNDPLRELQEMEESTRKRLGDLPPEDASRMADILRGAEAASEEEKPLCEQVGQYRRLLNAVLDLDEHLSVRLGGKHSFYKKFRNNT